MYDKEFLLFIYKRLAMKHGEDVSVDYMQKLRSIIDDTDPKQLTPNVTCNHKWSKLNDKLGFCEKCLITGKIKHVNKTEG
ncbi:MAG: hypothetical protein COA47_10175 [Robiginitomaculum sp.]|nr:MAG: hypothetical protein COA47_10175 [Robiginitomaculum sp.]